VATPGTNTKETRFEMYDLLFSKLIYSTDCQWACRDQGGTEITHTHQTPEVLTKISALKVPETAPTNILVTETLLTHQKVTKPSPMQSKIPELVPVTPVTDHVMKVAILHI